MTPIIGIAGPAGSGKDTFAQLFSKYTNSTLVAQADPMKRFVRDVFGFTSEQLWGPSEARNVPDPRFDTLEGWEEARGQMRHGHEWLRDLYRHVDLPKETAREALWNWFYAVGKSRNVQLKCEWKRLDKVKYLYPRVWKEKWEGIEPLTARYVLQTLGTEYGRTVKSTVWNEYALSIAKKLLSGGYSYDREKGLHLQAKATTDWVVITDVRFRNEFVGIKSMGGLIIKIENPEGVTEVSGGVKGHKSEAELGGIPRHFYDIIVKNEKKRGLIVLENQAAAVARYFQQYTVQF